MRVLGLGKSCIIQISHYPNFALAKHLAIYFITTNIWLIRNLANATFPQAQKSHQARTLCTDFWNWGFLNVRNKTKLIINESKILHQQLVGYFPLEARYFEAALAHTFRASCLEVSVQLCSLYKYCDHFCDSLAKEILCLT